MTCNPILTIEYLNDQFAALRTRLNVFSEMYVIFQEEMMDFQKDLNVLKEEMIKEKSKEET